MKASKDLHVRVVAAVVKQGNRFLITQRRPEAILPLLWEFPGGRVEDGESDEEALRRELRERLGAEIDVGPELATMVHEYERYSVTLVVFETTLRSDRLQAGRVNDYGWVTSEEFDDYEFPPADQATMDKLLGFAVADS